MNGGKNIRDFNPTHNQAHLQVARANTQPKPVKEPALPAALTEKIKHETLTRGIVNKGFSGFRGAVIRPKIGCNLTGKKPAIPY
jgi:hypothetical protein